MYSTTAVCIPQTQNLLNTLFVYIIQSFILITHGIAITSDFTQITHRMASLVGAHYFDPPWDGLISQCTLFITGDSYTPIRGTSITREHLTLLVTLDILMDDLTSACDLNILLKEIIN